MKLITEREKNVNKIQERVTDCTSQFTKNQSNFFSTVTWRQLK